MFTCDVAFSSVVEGKGRENLFVEEKGQNADPEYLKFSWSANQLFAYFCTDKVTFVTQEIRYVDNEASMEARSKGNDNEALRLSAVTVAHSFDMRFLNSSSDVKVSGVDEQKTKFDYYLANCPDGILAAASFSKILYTNVYPNIDLEFYFDGQKLKYNFIVYEGGNVADIKIEWAGVENIDLTESGITFKVGDFNFVDMPPVSLSGAASVDTKYTLDGNVVGFYIGDYDAHSTLTIDPGITWSSDLEYNGYGTWGDIVHNSDGNYFYYVDWEWSPSAADVSNYLNSAATSNHYGTAGGNDIIISKFKSTGDLVWVCQYGGDSDDDIRGAVLYDEHNEKLYVAGRTKSSGFPLQARSGAYNLNWSNATSGSSTYSTGGTRGFLLMFDSNNTRQWATLLDRGINLETFDMAVNASGSVYLVGQAGSFSYREYTMYGSQLAQIPYGSGYQGGIVYGSTEYQKYSYSFVMEFSSAGAMIWSTYLPVETLVTGNYDTNMTGRASDIEIDADGSFYIVGDDLWSSSNYRFSTALISATYTNRGQDDMFYMKFNSNNQPIPAWGGYVGGAGFDKINVGAANGDIELDSQKRLYVTGHSYSADFPHVSPPDDCGYYRDVITGTVTNNVSGTQDGYIFRINTNSNGTSSIDYSTYFGGDGYTAMKRMYKDAADNLWLCGEQNALAMAAIPVDGYYNQSFVGTQSAFFAQLTRFNELMWLSYYGPSTYYGGFETYSPDEDHVTLYYAAQSNNRTNVGGGYQYLFANSYACTKAMVIQHDVISGIEPTIVLPSGVSCSVNTITVSGTLPTGASWHWYTGSCGGTEITAGLSGVNNSTLDISSYPAGTTFYVQAEGQCLVSSCAEYTKQESVSIASTSLVEPSCHGECDGSITVTVDGGIAPYTYLWSNNTSETTNETSAQLVGLCAGAYSVTVRDANGCESGGARETTQECFRITDILFNSCDFTAEGYNEMVTLLIGPNDLNANNMNINWPTSGVSFTGFCENQSIVDGINASITGGGHVITPVNGVLPANSEVLIITSTRFVYGSFDFSGLDHDVYILFQCNNSVETGHFGNSTGSTRNFSVSFTSPSCSSQVSYTPQTNLDGDAVHYNADGTVEYYNNGCQAPVFYEELVLSDPDEISLSYSSISGYQDVEIGAASPVTNCSGNSTYTATGLPAGLTINQSTGVISGTPTAQSSGNIEVTLSCGGCEAIYNVGYTITEQPDLTGCIIDEDFSEITTGTQASPGGTELSAGSISDFPTTSKAYPAGGVVKLGSSSAIGYIQTAALDLSVPFYVEFDVKGWNGAAGNVEVVVSGGQTQTVAYAADDFQTKHIDFNAATASSTVRISTTSASKRAFIDNVRVCYPSSCTMTATARQTSGTCEGNIGIEVEATNGTGQLSYSWDNGAGTAAQYNNAVSGTTYNVVVADEAGCTANASVTPVQTGLPVITPSFSPIVCNGGTTSIVLTVSGGTGAPYTYQWEENSSTTNTISGVSAGTYNVTVRDANCSATSSVSVSEPETITFSVTSTPQVCNTLGTAAVENVQGGNGGYTYAWSNSASDASVNVQAGNYNVTVRDVEGCSATATVSLGSNPTAVSFDAVASNPNCSDGTGSIAVSNIVGTANYTIAWTGGSQDGVSADNYTITGLGAGDYTVTVTDANGCSATQSGLSVEIPAEITYSVSMVEQVCATPGTITLENVAGGNGGYSYVWHNSTGEVVGSDSNVLSGVNAGVYNLTVSDANDCEVTDAITLGSSSGSVSFTPVAHDLLCYANGSGRIEIQSITGNSPYSVAWSSASANGSQGNITASQFEITNLPAGSYTVVVTDADQCSQMATAVVSQPDSLAATASLLAAIKCHGDTFGVTAGALGGYLETGNEYSYHWSNNVNQQSQSGLSEYGPYNVTVSDDNGCFAMASVEAIEPALLQIAISADDILCNGQTTTVSVTGSGGTGAYTGTGSFENVSASVDAYTYTITDENNCSATGNILIQEPNPITISFENIVAQTCETLGSADLSISGGTGVFSYSFDNGNASTYNSVTTINLTSGTHSVTVSDANVCSATQTVNIGSGTTMSLSVPDTTHVLCNGGNNGSFSIEVANGTSPYSIAWTSGIITENTSSHIFENLLGGTYAVNVTDANGCSASVSVSIQEPSPVVATSSAAQILCHGGSAAVTVSAVGGVAPYQNTGTYTLSAGDYDYIVTDANGCPSPVHVHLAEPSALSVTASTTDAQCNGGNGSAHLQISGGVSPYTVHWQDNSTGVNNTHLPVNTTFGYTVTDQNGCTEQGSVSASQPESLALELSAESVSCYGLSDGRVSIATLSGGTQPYTYSWNNGYHGNELLGVASGNYTLSVSDGHGCSIAANATVSQPTALSARVNAANVVCGTSAGSLMLNVSGGTYPYTYVWSNGSQSDSQSGVVEGTYSVTVNDQNGCSATSSARVGITGGIAVSIDEVSPISCYGMSDASISVVAENVQLPALYMWSNGFASTTQNGLGAGTYSITVSDAWGCIGTASHQVVSPTEITLTSQVVNPLCYGTTDGSIAVEVGGGRPPYNYMWTNGSVGSSLINVRAGTYGLVVSDSEGCALRREFTLSSPQEIAVDAEITDASCYGQANGTITVTALGGVAPYLFGVGKNPTMQDDSIFEHLAAGYYNVVVSDANGCTSDIQVTVSQPESMEVVVAVKEPTCRNSNDGSIEIFVSGGAHPYVYALDSYVSDSSLFEQLDPGMYSVAVTDANGCFVVERGIVVPANWINCIDIPDVFTPNGDGINDEWLIEHIDMFPDAHIYVFNRWGQLLYKGQGNDAPWDGRFRGHFVPSGVYTYIVDLGENMEKFEGTVTVLY